MQQEADAHKVKKRGYNYSSLLCVVVVTPVENTVFTLKALPRKNTSEKDGLGTFAQGHRLQFDRLNSVF